MAMLVLTCLIFISASRGPALNGTLTVASVSVSYTHLDVYKRQELDRTGAYPIHRDPPKFEDLTTVQEVLYTCLLYTSRCV